MPKEVTINKYTLKEQKIINSTFIETPEWIKNKKSIINPQNYKDNKCFQHSLIVS